MQHNRKNFEFNSSEFKKMLFFEFVNIEIYNICCPRKFSKKLQRSPAAIHRQFTVKLKLQNTVTRPEYRFLHTKTREAAPEFFLCADRYLASLSSHLQI